MLEKIFDSISQIYSEERFRRDTEEFNRLEGSVCHSDFDRSTAWLAEQLIEAGFSAIDLTHDELAKEHVRHMVGGHSALAQDERLLRFVFPERPGALLKFLSLMQPNWNISLFHYRNQGADYGRILVGIQVPKADNKAFLKFLGTLGYPYVEETDNPVYRLFL